MKRKNLNYISELEPLSKKYKYTFNKYKKLKFKHEYEDNINALQDIILRDKLSSLSVNDNYIKNEQYKNEQYKNEQYKNEQFKNEQYKNKQYKNEQYNNEQYKNEQYKNEQYKNKLDNPYWLDIY